jgi:hypothetical protein
MLPIGKDECREEIFKLGRSDRHSGGATTWQRKNDETVMLPANRWRRHCAYSAALHRERGVATVNEKLRREKLT